MHGGSYLNSFFTSLPPCGEGIFCRVVIGFRNIKLADANYLSSATTSATTSCGLAARVGDY